MLALLVTFSPLYGLGRNVLGEIPGVAFLVLGFALISKRKWLLAGLALGLAMAAKPIFLIFIIPSLIIALIIHRKELSRADLRLFILSALIPVLAWFALQFHGDSLSSIISMYSGNPDSLSLFSIIFSNLARIIHEPQVLYATLLSLASIICYILRRKHKESVSFAETLLMICVFLNILAYFKTRGYYRYFAPAEILALIYLPIAFTTFLKSKIKYIILSALIIFQLYQTFFLAWVPEHYGSTKNYIIAGEVGNLKESPVLFWQTPELVPFYTSNNYYQYIKFADNIIRGEKETGDVLIARVPEIVIMPTELASSSPALANGYVYQREFDAYTILKRQSK